MVSKTRNIKEYNKLQYFSTLIARYSFLIEQIIDLPEIDLRDDMNLLTYSDIELFETLGLLCRCLTICFSNSIDYEYSKTLVKICQP